MPKTKEQYEAIRNKSKATIMEAALELFANQGFHNTTISQIAKSAGVSKGLLYNYFKGKDELLSAIMLDAFQEGSEIITEELKLPDTPKEHLSHIIDGFVAMLKNRTQHWKLLTALSFQEDANTKMQAEIMPKKDVIIEQFIHLCEEIGLEEPEKEAYLIGAILDGMAMAYINLGDEYPFDDMVKFVKDKYCR